MTSRASSLRIIVTGIVGAIPVGGVAWDYLQYAVGLSRLGHEVIYHEDTWTWPYDPVANSVVETASYSVGYIKRFFETYAPDLSERWHYRHLSSESFGMSHADFQSYAKTADLFLNISAANPIPEGLGSQCVKAFLDTDPGYNQIVLAEQPPWSENIKRWVDEFETYDRYLTYAENIAADDCLVPQLGVNWISTRMPIVMSLWADLAPAVDNSPWSTVMTWNDFRGPLVYRGQEYGSKGVEFSRIASLPTQISSPLKIAVGGSNAPIRNLRIQGWEVVDGPTVSLTPDRYRNFILQSRGEISTAKNVYVAMRTGWFSCRTACYLAAGRPAVVQDTGFSKYLPVGVGLLSFGSMEEAKRAIESVETDYMKHARAAREIAAEYLNSENVLAQMVEAIFRAS